MRSLGPATARLEFSKEADEMLLILLWLLGVPLGLIILLFLLGVGH